MPNGHYAWTTPYGRVTTMPTTPVGGYTPPEYTPPAYAPGQYATAPTQYSQPSWAGITTVMPGNTLYGLARQHGTTVAEIMRINNLTSTLIRPGQSLYVVDPATQRPVVTDPHDPQMVPAGSGWDVPGMRPPALGIWPDAPAQPGWQTMTPQDYVDQGLQWAATGGQGTPVGPPTPTDYYAPPGTAPGTVPTGGPGAPPAPGPGPAPTPGPGDGDGDGTPTGPSWWGENVFGEGWVYLPVAPGEVPTQWQGGDEGEQPVGPGWHNLRYLRYINQLPPMWREWFGDVMQSQQQYWDDPTMAPVQWMPTSAGQQRAPLYMWEPLAGAPTPVPSQHWTQPPGAPYVPPGGLTATHGTTPPAPGSPVSPLEPGRTPQLWEPDEPFYPVPLPIAE